MRFFIFLFSLSFAFSCQKNAQTSNLEEQAFTLLKTKCYTCHSPSGSMGGRLAPPMEAVKMHYINENTSEADFKKAVVGFVMSPSYEASKMNGAIKRFGLMPQMNFDETEVSKIASFLYHNEIEKPEWLNDHMKGHKMGANDSMEAKEIDSYLVKGQKIALTTKSVLGKNLMNALNEGGTERAIPFCNIKAIPLTDSMSKATGTIIQRVSDKPRNPDNQASSVELDFIRAMKKSLALGEEAKPELLKNSKTAIGYYPITTNAMCLQCHGNDLAVRTKELLSEKYPNDKAVGYSDNELRGMWKVVMNLED